MTPKDSPLPPCTATSGGLVEHQQPLVLVNDRALERLDQRRRHAFAVPPGRLSRTGGSRTESPVASRCSGPARRPLTRTSPRRISRKIRLRGTPGSSCASTLSSR